MSQSRNDGYEMYKKRMIHVQSCCFAYLNLSVFFPVPIVVIKKFCYHGNMTSHFSSLFWPSLTSRNICSKKASGSVFSQLRHRLGMSKFAIPPLMPNSQEQPDIQATPLHFSLTFYGYNPVYIPQNKNSAISLESFLTVCPCHQFVLNEQNTFLCMVFLERCCKK